MEDKWENGFRLLRIMSEKLTCLKEFEAEYKGADVRAKLQVVTTEWEVVPEG